MDTFETLGAVAHPGGMLVCRPELTVGVVRAVSRPSSLEIELLARLPLDRRDAAARQRDIRDGVTVRPAPRRLLPEYDEGMDLRVGRLDHTGRAHWEYPWSSSGWSGDDSSGSVGQSYRSAFRFPALFGETSFVFAWPEIGFPETVVTLPLPDRTTVARAAISIWRAPLEVLPVPEGLTHVAGVHHHAPAVESGTNVAPPRVLHRQDDRVAVVLTRLVAVGSLLSLELFSIGRAAGDVWEFVPFRRAPAAPDDPTWLRTGHSGASVAIVRGSEAVWLQHGDGSFFGGDRTVSGSQEFTVERPDDDVLDLIVAWPRAGLDDARVRIPLTP
ncbi:hypothetical protein [Lentzea sp. NPDC059081]|uniref:hypothetical protein n=1 Tax=Lentzea sp. NPDC059081 TaxID=3346719 RepID=UPI00369C1E21